MSARRGVFGQRILMSHYWGVKQFRPATWIRLPRGEPPLRQKLVPSPVNRPLRALAGQRSRLLRDGVFHESMDRLGPGKDRALRGAPIVERRQEFIRGAHLKGSDLRLYHASSCVECVDIWLTRHVLRVIT